MTDVSVVFPCLNEEETVGICIDKAKKVFSDLKIDGEVVVVDNGSTDNSAKIAKEHGARLIEEKKRGYGNAYIRGFKEAKGKTIVMADADNTYDLLEMPKFLDLINEGADFVMGSRLKGEMEPGAMPWLHRYIGNPALTFMLNLFFKAGISDSHCGMRAIKKSALERLDLKMPSMEFASEMFIKAVKNGLSIKEIPITYSKRGGGEAKLKSFEHGWRHVRYMLLYEPTALFLIPGVLSFLVGLVALAVITTRIHSMVLGSLFTILGFQIITLGVYSKIFAIVRGIERPDGITKFFIRYEALEYEMLLGFLIFLAGAGIGVMVIMSWVTAGFGELSQIRGAIISSTLAIIGIQMIFSAIFSSMLLLDRVEEE